MGDLAIMMVLRESIGHCVDAISLFFAESRFPGGGEGDPWERGAGCGSARKTRSATPAPVYGALAPAPVPVPSTRRDRRLSGGSDRPPGDICGTTGVPAGGEHAKPPGFAVTRRCAKRGLPGQKPAEHPGGPKKRRIFTGVQMSPRPESSERIRCTARLASSGTLPPVMISLPDPKRRTTTFGSSSR